MLRHLLIHDVPAPFLDPGPERRQAFDSAQVATALTSEIRELSVPLFKQMVGHLFTRSGLRDAKGRRYGLPVHIHDLCDSHARLNHSAPQPIRVLHARQNETAGLPRQHVPYQLLFLLDRILGDTKDRPHVHFGQRVVDPRENFDKHGVLQRRQDHPDHRVFDTALHGSHAVLNIPQFGHSPGYPRFDAFGNIAIAAQNSAHSHLADASRSRHIVHRRSRRF